MSLWGPTAYRIGHIIDTRIDSRRSVVQEVVITNFDDHVLTWICLVVVGKCSQSQHIVGKGINRDTSTSKPVQKPVMVSIEAFGDPELLRVALIHS